MPNTAHMRFKCRHCGKDISVEGNVFVHEGQRANINVSTQGIEIKSFICNLCGKVNLCVTTKHYGNDLKEVENAKNKVKNLFVYPISVAPEKIEFVPAKYMKEFNEALWVKDISPKSCALMCRRITEIVLEEKCGCKKFNLSAKLDEFKKQYTPSDFVVQSIEYIIGAGNAVAHNKKDFQYNLITITKNDCNVLLESVRELFDIAFVKPKMAERNTKMWQKVQTPKKK